MRVFKCQLAGLLFFNILCSEMSHHWPNTLLAGQDDRPLSWDSGLSIFDTCVLTNNVGVEKKKILTACGFLCSSKSCVKRI